MRGPGWLIIRLYALLKLHHHATHPFLRYIFLTQAELASKIGLSRRAILNAEKGNVQLKNLVAIMAGLDLVDHLNFFLPVQEISPLQLSKLKGKKRQRASRSQKKELPIRGDKPLW